MKTIAPFLLLLFVISLPVQQAYAQYTYTWGKNSGGIGNDYGYGNDVDAAGNVYSIGTFTNTADFDPSAGVANLTAVASSDIFVRKLDANGNFQWVKQFGGTFSDFGYSIAVDDAGNVYTTGMYYNTVDFDPGPGTANLTAVGVNDVFVSKLDANGNFVWAKSLGGSGADQGQSIAVDDAGNVYICGHFQNTADFDPGPGSANLSSGGNYDVFVCKLDASGNYVWAKGFGDSNNDYGNSLAVDDAGNVITTGYFQGTVDFDPGGGAPKNLSSAGSSDIFIQKLDANGNYVWAKAIGGPTFDYPSSLALDKDGSPHITGYFQGTIDFDPGSGTANLTANGEDVFVCKLDAAGDYVWAINIGGSNGESGRSIAVDSCKSVYVLGYAYSTTIDFDPGAGVANETNTGGTAVFLAKYDSLGGYLASMMLSPGENTAPKDRGLALYGTSAFITITCRYNTVDFDPGTGVVTLPHNGNQDIATARYEGPALTCSTCDLNAPYVVGSATADTSLYLTDSTFSIKLSEPIQCPTIQGNAAEFYLDCTGSTTAAACASNSFISATGINCTSWSGGIDTTRWLTIELDNPVPSTYNNDWKLVVSSSAGLTTADTCGNVLEPDPVGAGIPGATSGSAIILPIEFVSFTAAPMDQLVVTNWTISDYNTIAYFEILRSDDAKTFQPIGTVLATDDALDYTFLDRDPLPDYAYYQLRSHEEDGAISYSEVVGVQFIGTSGFSLYPNPTQQDVNLSVFSIKNETAIISLVNISGQEIHHSEAALRKGSNTLNLDTRSLSHGLYFVKVMTTSGQFYVEEFVKE